MKKIPITILLGKEECVVQGYHINEFMSCHQTLKEHDMNEEWSLVHTATGLWCGGSSKLKYCKELAEKYMELPYPWSAKDMDTIEVFYGMVGKSVLDPIRELREEYRKK